MGSKLWAAEFKAFTIKPLKPEGFRKEENRNKVETPVLCSAAAMQQNKDIRLFLLHQELLYSVDFHPPDSGHDMKL